jgi:hypothetical protein
LTWVCAAWSGFAAEATGPTGKLQHPTSPEQTPQGLASSDWESIRAAYQAGRPGPIAQQTYLKAHNRDLNDKFGCAVAVSGDTVVIGAKYENSSATGVNGTPDVAATRAGAAYVFVRSGTTWVQQAYLKPSHVNAHDEFGWAVAIAGDTVVVGATREDSSTTGVNSTPNESAKDSGAAYIFVRNGTNWSQQAYLKANQVTANDAFGRAVAMSGDTVVVGAPNEFLDENGVPPVPGAAYVFVRSGTTWTQQARLQAPQGGSGREFGSSVAVDRDTLIVGAMRDAGGATGVTGSPKDHAQVGGAAYVFVRSGTVWTQQAYFKASQITAGDRFGHSVAISGDTAVVGALFEDSSSTGVNSTPNESATDAGAAYIFVRSGTTWTQQAYLKAHQVTGGDYFGRWVTLTGDTVVVGAFMEDSGTTGVNSVPDESAVSSGAAYVFVRRGTSWFQHTYLKAPTVKAGHEFGHAVAVSDDTLVVGATFDDISTSRGGAAYVYTGLRPPAFVETVTPAGTDWVSREPARRWRALAFSRDGQRLLAAVDGGRLQVSTDAGATWTPCAPERAWLAVASSADGSRLVAAVDRGPLFRSADAGVTWVECAPGRAWSGLATSADGLRLAAVADGAPIQLSTNAGVSWAAVDKGRFWKGIALSADGQTLAAIVEDGPVLVSTNGGGTWTPRTEAKAWTSVAASADGSVLAATVWDGPVFLSSDSGLTWNPWTTDRFWHAVSCSADGRRLIAAETLGRLHLSHDSGLTWTEHLDNRDWAAVAWAGDGERVAAVARDGLFFASSSRVTPYRILVPARGGPTQLRDFVAVLTSGAAHGPGRPLRWAVECANPDLFVSPPSLDGEGTLNFVAAGRPGLARLILTAQGGRRADLSERHTVDLDLRIPDAK